LIVPCGITDKPVTSLEQEMAESGPSGARKVPALEDLAQQVARNFGRVFEAQTLWLESLDALLSSPGMSDYDTTPANQDTPARAPEEIRRIAGEKDTFIV
jgi:lipoyl(octanoyl) transferase